MTRKVPKRILLKISGEALLGGSDYGIDPDTLNAIASEIRDVREMGVQVAVVVGNKRVWVPATDVERVLSETAIAELAKRPVGRLSRGQRQRLGFAQALLGDPDAKIVTACQSHELDQARLQGVGQRIGRESEFGGHLLGVLEVVPRGDGGLVLEGDRQALQRAGGAPVADAGRPGPSAARRRGRGGRRDCIQLRW